jgi:hypothetical protein
MAIQLSSSLALDSLVKGVKSALAFFTTDTKKRRR